MSYKKLRYLRHFGGKLSLLLPLNHRTTNVYTIAVLNSLVLQTKIQKVNLFQTTVNIYSSSIRRDVRSKNFVVVAFVFFVVVVNNNSNNN